MSLAVTLAGIAWDPTIRGIGVVAIGSSVLFGTVWLMLATNVGTRLGALMTFSGFFGWMFIMAVVWWIYGIGWVGSAPVWHALDLNVGCTEETREAGDSSIRPSSRTPMSSSLPPTAKRPSASTHRRSTPPASRA
jgi:hypothetical protein